MLLHVFLAFSFAQAKPNNYQIQSWTTDNGLPQNTIYSILQTPDGYLWMTTLDGLVRYDGVRFTVFNKNNTPGIESNRFTKLVLDGQGRLWIGTELNFITRYYQGSFQTYRFNSNNQHDEFLKLSLNAQQELIVASNHDVFKWDGAGFIKYAPLAGKNSSNIFLWGKDGAFWYTEKQTIFRVQDNQITEYRLPFANADIRFTKLFEDSRGRIWISTQNAGLFVFENEKIDEYPLAKDFGADIAPNIEDKEGNIWAGGVIISPDGKVNRLTTSQGLSENLTTTVFQDREDNIWIGTAHRGINRLTRRNVGFYSPADGLTATVTHPIFQDRAGDVWIGGESLTKYRSGNFSAVPGREKLPAAVTAINQDSGGRLWFGTWGGAYYLENNQFTDFSAKFGQPAAVYAIHEGKTSAALWFATGVGLFRYRNDVMTLLTTADGLAGNDVKVIHESDDGALWIGTYGGLSRLKDGIFTTFTTKNGLASNQVRSIYEDDEGVFWIGSYDGGLTRLKDGKFTRYTSKNGLFNDGVFQILEDGSRNFWMSSNRGIYRVARQQLNDFAEGKINHIESIALGKTDGLLETECNGGQQPAGIKTSDGKLWFPTQGGVAVIDPRKIKTNPILPPVVIESALVDGETIPLNERIEIAPGKNNLEIAYTGLSFVKPEFVRFRYKLEGQDDNWIEAGNRRTAYYSYLPPGDYKFRVIAANSDGVWNKEGAEIRIIVQPPFYRTWWFLILSFAVLGSTAFLFYRQRVTRLEKEKAAQQAFSSELIESQERDRKRIAAELHDGLGQSLVIIKNRAILSLDKRDNSESAFEQLDEIAAAATEAINEVREITYNLRPYQLDRLGLSKAIGSMIRRAGDEIEFETQIDNIDGAFPPEAEINVYRIMQESINNILKHSRANHASVQIRRAPNSIEILIQDNGRGFETHSVRTGFGLIGINERARMLGGNFSIHSTPGQGTIINLKLPCSALNKNN